MRQGATSAVAGRRAVFSTSGTRGTTDNEAVANRPSVESNQGLHVGRRRTYTRETNRRREEKQNEVKRRRLGS